VVLFFIRAFLREGKKRISNITKKCNPKRDLVHNNKTKSMFMPLLHLFYSTMKVCLPAALIGLLTLCFSNPTTAQKGRQISISQEIAWTDLAKQPGLDPVDYFFPGAHFNDSQNLPWFVYRLRLKQAQNIPAYRFSAQEVTSLPDVFVAKVSAGELQSDWQTRVELSDAGGIPYLIIYILPIRERNGVVERLNSFTLEIDQDGQSGGLRSGGGEPFPFTDHSVLAEGTWYRLAIARDGVYRIDRSFLSELGVDLSALNPQQINIYGNGGELLPADNSIFRYDDLQKNAIFVSGEEDGTFDSGDYILFYGKGSDSWELKNSTTLGRKRWLHNKHYYSDSAHYFIRIDDPSPSRIATGQWPDAPDTHVSTRFQDFQFIENDLYNLAKSGREFYGDEFDINTSQTYTFSFPNIASVPASVDFAGISRSIGGNSTFNISCQGGTGSVSPGIVGVAVTSPAGLTGVSSFTFAPSNSSVVVAVSYQKINAQAVGWLDYITTNATRNLAFTGNQMKFRDSTAVAPGGVARYQLSQASTVFEIWDLSNPLQPVRIPFESTADILEWKLNHESIHELIAFRNSGYLAPTPKGRVENQDLHSLATPDLMIISSPKLLSAAEELAQVHTEEGLQVAIVTPSQVFNEFSSGNPDVTAFRMLMLMFYRRANGDPEAMADNLLLFGDGNYLQNKGLDAHNDFNVMVFESNNSLSPTASYVSDDYFVLLSDNDTDSPTGLLDCGVGRIPTSNLNEANQYVNKVKRYLAENSSSSASGLCIGSDAETPFGSWRNTITFVSDDQDGNGGATETVHLSSSDQITRAVGERHPEYDIVKMYMDAYTQVTTPGGERYPEGEQAIQQRVQNGTLLLTYIGHGGERGWAHERILDIPTIENWTNRYRMPVFLTATCELARYDDPSFLSAGEILVKNPNGGAIAMLTTTRIVFSGENFQIDTAFFRVALDEANISRLSLGKINQLTKNGVPVGNDSKPNFSLLGDPALKMAYPRHSVFTTAINDVEIETFVDTLKSLQEVKITGYVGDEAGVKLTSFTGFVYPTVFDKQTRVLTQNNDGGAVQEFESFNKIIYRGKASVIGGDFSFRFVVPFDINYTVDSARVSYYAVSGSLDAHGSNQDFMIGSVLSDAQLNTIGPEIAAFMNDSSFVSGGITNSDPILFVRLADENGINTVGNGIGHDLTAVLDGNAQNPIVLNDFYEADLDTYQSGEVRFQLSNLSPGEHSVRVKAWDVHNNSNEATIEFVVAENEDIALNHVLNYPNPFTTSTSFFFEHNQACELLEVRIQIFTIGGKLVKTINNQVRQSGFRSEPIAWNGLDDFGDQLAKGVYVYKLEVRNPFGKRAEKFEKLVILR